MKKGLIIGIAVLLTIAVACKKDKHFDRDTFFLEQPQCKSFEKGNDDLIICFDKWISDNRCPVGHACITSGTAVAEFSFTVNNTKHTFQLATSYGPPLYNIPLDTTISNYKIEFLDLTPYPGEIDIPVPNKAKLRITKL